MATVHSPLSGSIAAPAASGSSLKRWIIRHPVLSYLIVAYVVTWTIFAIPLLSRSGIGVLGFDAPPVEVFILAAAVFGLAGSAFLVTAIVDGRSGVRALASRYIRVRVGIQWYLFAVFGLLATALLGTMVVYGFAPLTALATQWPLLIAYLIQVMLVTALVNLWEETGWTGFMFTRLQPRYGALVASLLVAPAFGGIHLPLLFVNDALTTGRLSPQEIPLFVLYLLVLFSVPVRIIASWLYNNARGSLLLVGLFHGALGATAGAVALPYLVPKGAHLTLEVYGAFAVLAVILVAATRGRLSYRANSADLQPSPQRQER